MFDEYLREKRKKYEEKVENKSLRRLAAGLLIVIAVLFILAVFLICGRVKAEAGAGFSGLACSSTYMEEEFVDPEPICDMNEKPVISAETRARLVLIGRIAEGVRKIGKDKGGGRWWECGRTYTEDEEVGAAIEWAHRIVMLASDYSDRGSLNGYQLNPWEIAGVAANECGFDRCALGKYPRKWGYEHGTLKRSRLSISHTYEDIARTLNDPRGATQFNTSGLDGAPLHVLWRCDKGMCRPKFNKEQLPPIPMAEVFSLGMGFEYNVREFKKRAIDNRTSTPSLYWKGYRCDWYREKIVNWEKRLGAKKDEI